MRLLFAEMTDYELLPAQKARLVTQTWQNTSCKTSYDYKKNGKKEKKDQIIFQKPSDWKSNKEINKIHAFQNGKAIKVPENKIDVRELFM